MVQAEMDSVEALTSAFKGAHGVFCLTQFWEKFDSALEKQHAINLANACS